MGSAYPPPMDWCQVGPRPRLLAPLPPQPLLQAKPLVLGWLQARWKASVPLAHPEAVDWSPLGSCSLILAPVPQEQVQSPPPWQNKVGLGWLQANRHPSVP